MPRDSAASALASPAILLYALLGWLMHWSLIVGLSVVTTAVTGTDLILANALFTVGLWVIMLLVIGVFGASTLRGRAGPIARMTVAWRPASA